MPVSGDVVTLSFSLAINNTPTGFWGNLIQAMNDNQGAITAIVGMLTLSVLVIQLWIMYRQAEISKEQARISNRANEISREVAFLPTQEKILWEWLYEMDKLKNTIMKIHRIDFKTQDLHDIIKEIADNGASLLFKSRHSYLFFIKEIAEEIKKWESYSRDQNNLLITMRRVQEHNDKQNKPMTWEDFNNKNNAFYVVSVQEIERIYELSNNIFSSLEDSKTKAILLFKQGQP